MGENHNTEAQNWLSTNKTDPDQNRRKQQCTGQEWYFLYLESKSLKKTEATEMQLYQQNMSVVSLPSYSFKELRKFSLLFPGSYPRPGNKDFWNGT